MACWESCRAGGWLALGVALPLDFRPQATTPRVQGRADDEQEAALLAVAMTARRHEPDASVISDGAQ